MQCVAVAGLLLLVVYQNTSGEKSPFFSDFFLVLEEESTATKMFGDCEDEQYQLLQVMLCNSLIGLIKVWFNENFKWLCSYVVPRDRSSG